MSINRIQIASLAIPVDIVEEEYQNHCGLLQKINAYRVTPFYEGTRLVRTSLAQHNDVVGVDFTPCAALFVVRTVLSLEALEALLRGLIDGDFTVLPLSSVLETQE